MMRYFTGKDKFAAYVVDQLQYLKPDSAWTMTITAGQYEVFCVQTVIGVSSDDIGYPTEKPSFDALPTT